MSDNEHERQWKRMYTLGGIAAILSLIAVVADIFIGSSTGGNLSELPQTAVERFAQFQQNAWLGLYNLDFKHGQSVDFDPRLFCVICRSSQN